MNKYQYPPFNSDVFWNPEEKIIGVVGLAPIATSDFYKKINTLIAAKKDWDYPHLIIDSNPKIPSRGRCLELNETNPVPYIINSIENLIKHGAGIIAIPCNTAHIFYNEYSAKFKVEIPNIISVTVKSVEDTIIKHNLRKSVVVLASHSLIKQNIYNFFLKNKKIISVDVEENYQILINSLIEGVKQGKDLNILWKKFNLIFNYYKKMTDIIVLGCTELSLIYSLEVSKEMIFIDSNYELAKECLGLSKNDAYCLTL